MRLGQIITAKVQAKHIRNGKVIGMRFSEKKIPITQDIFDLYNSEKIGRNIFKLIKALCQGGK